MATLVGAYRFCENLTRKQAKNFAFAFVFLPYKKQRAMNAVYAFARWVDDLADSETMTDEQKSRALGQCRDQLKTALAGNPKGPILTALAHTTATFGIPHQYFYQLIEGMEMDLYQTHYPDYPSLWKYCYHAASVVGLMTIEIFEFKRAFAGKKDEVRQYAIDMGIALQLTNILRDIQEDLDRGRVYLPQDELERFSLSEGELKKGQVSANFGAFMKFQVERARGYYQRASKLLPCLKGDAVFCPATLREIYFQLLQKIEGENYDVFSQRIRLTKGEKVAIALKMWALTFVTGA